MDFIFNDEVNIPVGGIILKGELIIPVQAEAIVIFSHGSGSSRLSSRNRQVATQLQENKFGTLLFDLLTEAEDTNYYNRFNINLLTDRLVGATKWLEKRQPQHNQIGYFGASTGAASALKAAARLHEIGAVVSRGGRPDLAGNDLEKVKAAVLLIVGSLDVEVLELNKQACQRLKGEKKLEVVEGASHLFEEKGTMEKVAALAVSWFEKYLLPVKIS